MLFDEKVNRRTRFDGWCGHTYQKCWSFGQLSEKEQQSYINETGFAAAGKVPDPKWGKEPQMKKRKQDDQSQVIPVDDDDEKEKKKSKSSDEKQKPDIFTAEVGLPKRSIVTEAKEKEVEEKEEKEKQKEDEEKKHKKEHKEKKEKKDKKEKNFERQNDLPVSQSCTLSGMESVRKASRTTAHVSTTICTTMYSQQPRESL